MPTAIVSLGSNLGDRKATLDSAVAALAATPGVQVVRRSTWYETSPIGGPGFQEPFLNGATLLETSLEPEALLTELQRIENEHGRVREEHWGPRTLDLDLLTYDDCVYDSLRLTLPHPRISYRKFVLRGLAEITPDSKLPRFARTYAALLHHLETTSNYAVFAGDDEGFLSQFAAEAADCAAAKLVEATPSDVPPFAELLAHRTLNYDTAIRFVEARVEAIRNSLADAGDKWVVDDAWLHSEAVLLEQRLADVDAVKFAAACNPILAEVAVGPKLIAMLGTKHNRHDEFRPPALLYAPPVRIAVDLTYGPMVYLDYSDRERALTEFAAALDAAR